MLYKFQKGGKEYRLTVSDGNAKTGAIPSISFPPITTCRPGAKCIKDCYACKMCRLYPSVAESYKNNLDAWKASPEIVRGSIVQTARCSKYFRYFVSGDIPDPDFLKMAVEIAGEIPATRFLIFTKKYEIVNDFINAGGEIPENLIIILSAWGEWEPENPHNLPTSNIIFRSQEIPDGANLCPGSCQNCVARGVGCWRMQRGERIYFKQH